MVKNQPSGTIWKPGTHQLEYGGQPTRFHVPKTTINQTYAKMREKINQNGYIPMGLDHFDLKQNPLLTKLLKKQGIDPHNIGQVLDIGLENHEIKIKKAQISNDTIQELYDNGELPAYSIVANSTVKDCPTNRVDKIVNEFTGMERVDFVSRGGCKDCLVETDMITAKFSNGGTIMANEEIKENIEENLEELQESEEVEEIEATEEEVQTEETEEIEDEPLTLAMVKETIIDIVKPLIEGETQTVAAKLANIEEENKTLKLGAKIDKKIKAGYATPAMKTGLIATGLNIEENEFDEILASLSTKVWDGEQTADTSIEASESNTKEEMSIDEALKRLGGQ